MLTCGSSFCVSNVMFTKKRNSEKQSQSLARNTISGLFGSHVDPLSIKLEGCILTTEPFLPGCVWLFELQNILFGMVFNVFGQWGYFRHVLMKLQAFQSPLMMVGGPLALAGTSGRGRGRGGTGGLNALKYQEIQFVTSEHSLLILCLSKIVLEHPRTLVAIFTHLLVSLRSLLFQDLLSGLCVSIWVSISWKISQFSSYITSKLATFPFWANGSFLTKLSWGIFNLQKCSRENLYQLEWSWVRGWRSINTDKWIDKMHETESRPLFLAMARRDQKHTQQRDAWLDNIFISQLERTKQK